ncbi:MAG TPA: DUF2934 domain-containing protein [Novimethylophilus sp.]|uniref:DUF2934 domain-containing protein n=1 Tax=Novimethylophilus sp. TaxID=2137426 RepID=UPI002F42B062
MNATTSKSPQTTVGRKTSARRKQSVPAKSRQDMIAETAYYLAERRGFAPDCELQDWLEAECIIQEQFPEA